MYTSTTHTSLVKGTIDGPDTKWQCSHSHVFQTLKLCSRHCREYKHKMAVLMAMFTHPSDFFLSLPANSTDIKHKISAHSHVFTTFKLFRSQSTVDSTDTKWQCSQPCLCDLQTLFLKVSKKVQTQNGSAQSCVL